MAKLLQLSKIGCWLFLAVLIAAGCTRPESKTPGKAPTEEEKEHEHPDKGPHGGPLVELGNEEYHAEIVIDRPKKTLTLYILDGEAKEQVPIDAKEITLNLKAPLEQIKLMAQPEEKEKKASRFTATNERFGKDEKLRGEISVDIGGKQYPGDFDESKKGH